MRANLSVSPLSVFSPSYSRLRSRQLQLTATAAGMLFVTVLFYCFGGGVAIGDVNHVGLLPVVRRLLDPQYLPGDFGIQLRLEHHRVFAWMVALGSRFIGEDDTIIALTIAARAAQALALWELCRALRLGWAAYLAAGASIACAALFTGKGLESNDFLMSAAVMPPHFAHALALWGIAALIQRRYGLSAVCAGAAMLLHQQIGLIITLLFIPFWVRDRGAISGREKLAMTLGWLLLSSPSLYGLYDMVRHGLMHTRGASISLLDYIRLRQPHHFAFHVGHTAGVGLHLAVLWMLVRGLKRHNLGVAEGAVTPDEKRGLQMMLEMSLLLVVLAVIHFLDYYVLRNGKIAMMQFIRMSWLITVFSPLALLWWLQKRYEAVSPASSLAARRTGINAVLWVGLLGLAIFRIVGKHSDFSFAVTRYDENGGAWTKMCRWVLQHGPRDVRYLTPPGQMGFVSLTNRSNIVEFKINPDGAMYLAPWIERIRDEAGGSLPRRSKSLEIDEVLDQAYATLSERQLRALSDKYSARYAILPNSSSARFKVLYRNPGYRLVVLQDSSAG